MSTIFSKIVNGEIPCYKVAEDENYFAFLDIKPLAKGHTLVIPKKEVDYIFNLDDNTFSGLHLFSKKVAIAIEKVVKCKRIGTAVLGLEVPHTHIHLIPINKISDINFANPKLSFSDEEFKEIAEKISQQVIL
ncbi:MAG: HIT family hydrolase [Bacteroidetes bacterium GWA2_30_7]|nr:MAG: HIT family hydrolase [Bacteroidetes bacterium GWA2_30_7]